MTRPRPRRSRTRVRQSQLSSWYVERLYPMTQAEFFTHIEFRLCGALAQARLSEAPGLWCDGFVPESWACGVRPLLVSGKAWFGGLRGHHSVAYQEAWTFVLELHCDAASVESVPWAKLLPAESLHDWFVVDVERRRLHMVLHESDEPEANGATQPGGTD